LYFSKVVRFLIHFLIVLIGLNLQASGQSQSATVQANRAHDLDFRGQRTTGICYAFAEEQLMKDMTCTGNNCAKLDAAQWKYSIFDIVRAHRAFEQDGDFSVTVDNVADLLQGAPDFLPFLPGAVGISAGNCTLEKDLFRINGSAVLNPKPSDFPAMFDAIFNRFQSAHTTVPAGARSAAEIAKYNLPSTYQILDQLANQANNGRDLMARAVNFRSCADQVDAPSGNLQRVLAKDRASVSAAISKGLATQHSVMVALCGNPLAAEKTTAVCGAHAIVIKEQTSTSYLVVDSAFFSNRPRLSDGSMLLPKDVVVTAILERFAQAATNPNSVPVDPQMEALGHLMKGPDEVVANFILTTWQHLPPPQNQSTDVFVKTVLNPTLADLKISDVDTATWTNAFAAPEAQSSDGFRAVVTKFLNQMRVTDLGQLQLAKHLAEGHWLDTMEQRADIDENSPNVVWFD
jgi:hypothetical protein